MEVTSQQRPTISYKRKEAKSLLKRKVEIFLCSHIM
jgi:hypothetical protein